MSKKRGLGKGLEALLGNDHVDNSKKNSQVQMLSLEQLQPNPYQPRSVFNKEAISTLADSIRQHGIIQPLAVRPLGDDKYEIIAGERRFRAAKIAGLTEVPVVIHDINDSDSAAFALIENLQRENLNVIEKAEGIKRLIENFGLTHEACGKILGQSRSAISNTLRLLDLNSSVQEAIAEKAIDMGHARALLPLEHAEQYEALQKIRLNGLSVRETENLVQQLSADKPQTQRHRKSQKIKQLETQLSEKLKTKVKISQQKTGAGKITLNFGDEEALEKLSLSLGLK